MDPLRKKWSFERFSFRLGAVLASLGVSLPLCAAEAGRAPSLMLIEPAELVTTQLETESSTSGEEITLAEEPDGEASDPEVMQVSSETEPEAASGTLVSSLSGTSQADIEAAEEDGDSDVSPLFLNYFSIFYGPALKGGSSYLPNPDGSPDPSRPVFLKNFLTAGYSFTEDVALSATAYWTWRPVLGQQLLMQDPYLRLGYDGLIRGDGLNLYADFRVHFPVTAASRESDLRASFQLFEYLSYDTLDDVVTLGLFGSARTYLYGGQGVGNDLELYLGPALNVRVLPTVALTLLYEMNASHTFGAAPFVFKSDGTDLAPGVSWDVTPNLTLNPYLNIYPGSASARSTTFGMTVSWVLL